MSDEPMDEEDSFHRPVPCSMPFTRPLMSQAAAPVVPPPVQQDSDPDSDDSFDTFAPTASTQSTGGSSGSTNSNEQKTPATSQPRVVPNSQKPVTKPSTVPVPFSQQMTQKASFPSFPSTSRASASAQPQGLNLPVNGFGAGVHSAVTNVRVSGSTQKPNTPSGAPSSPNSLSRHRSANSVLRSTHTPPVRVPVLANRITPPSLESRPATPSGEVKMLRDQLENERHKCLRQQADFQKDTQKNIQNHKKELAEKDAIIKQQEKDIEMLKAANPFRSRDPSVPIKTPVIPRSFPTSSSNIEVKKIYPKIPTDFGNIRRTPRRPPQIKEPLSAFRHESKDDEEDSFQLFESFNPSATSTPKYTPLRQTGIRRPRDLDGDINDCAHGAPMAKRKAIFRKKRSRKELAEDKRKTREKVWREEDHIFHVRKKEKEKDELDKEEDEEKWLVAHLVGQLRNLEFRKTWERMTNTMKGRAKLLQQAEQGTTPDTKCRRCRLDERVGEKKEEEQEKEEKEWETKEDQRVERDKRGAEQLRALQYSNMLQNVGRRGIEELVGASQQIEQVEQEYEQKTRGVKRRTLDEIREEKKELWRAGMMDELREKGEMEAVLEKRQEGRHDDYIWTSESDDESSKFLSPFHVEKSSICSDCAHRRRAQLRIAKRNREKTKLKLECLNDYDVERREQLRNMSILTKSMMDAAEHELNFHVDEMLASRLCDDDEDEDKF
ncbi:unnamed protein product [Caenorhabditis sp. 36 PRJEB53466]|nr:unnamed protein product [Caenorhabditis sp. 36 PRJEB53466]